MNRRHCMIHVVSRKGVPGPRRHLLYEETIRTMLTSTSSNLCPSQKMEYIHSSQGGGLSDYAQDISIKPPEDIFDRHEVNAALYLMEELCTMKTSIVRNVLQSKRKARASPMDDLNVRPGTTTNVANVIELVHHAEQESEGNYGFTNINKKLGKIEEETKEAMRSRDWTDRGLEAVHLEYSCSKSLDNDFMTNTMPGMAFKRHGRLGRIVTEKLSKAVYEEFEMASLAAVGGVYRTYREQALLALRHISVREMVSVFSTLLVKEFMAVRSTAFISTQIQVTDLFIEKGLLQSPAQGEEGVVLLNRLMSMLDDIHEEASFRFNHDANMTSRFLRSSLDHPTFLLRSFRKFRERCLRMDAVRDAPEFAVELALQFQNWERLLRNDVSILRDAKQTVFDIILVAVTSIRILKKLLDVKDAGEIREVVRPYVAVLNLAIEEEFKETSATVIESLNAYCSVLGDHTRISISLFESIESSHLSDLQADTDSPENERVAFIMREIALLAHRAPRSAGLYPLLCSLTEELTFHLRFREVFRKLSTRDRQYLLNNPKDSMMLTLLRFESEHEIEPIATKAVGFIVIIFMYLLSTQQRGNMTAGASAATKSNVPVVRFNSPTGIDELGVCGLLLKVDPLNMKIAHPPTLKPKAWAEAGEGGVYDTLPSRPVVGSMSDVFLKTKPPMLHALDVVSKVPWRVSRFVLHVQEMIVVEGYGFHKIMPSFHPLTHMSLPTGFIPCESVQNSSDDSLFAKYLYNATERQHFLDVRAENLKQLREIFGVRQHYLMAIRTARNLVNKREIFFPHKIDFRGRMYPIVGRLNHTGSDPFRAMIEFADPVPLGPQGMYWLKVHLANVMGHNKLTFDERIQFVDEHIDEVVQSAEDPLGSERWWRSGEEPMQALHACREIYKAMKYSQKVEDYPSRLPVHIDGSCNGLQHYSAIGRDAHGGALVNLVPCDRPQDVYNGVLAEIKKSVLHDAQNDHVIALRCLGSGKGVDKDHLKRKTIKRAVMTVVYGVTSYGMSEMIRSELDSQNQLHNLWSKQAIQEMAIYVRDKLVESLGITFSQAQKCRSWLDTVTRMIWECQPRSMKQCFQWVTPLGLICRQPYTKGQSMHIYTQQGIIKSETGSLNFASRSQLTALPPNLIHSLDAVHLAMTALEMDKRNIPMAAVHDSFWTYAAHLSTLSHVLRHEFCALYDKYDPLWELKEQWEEQYFLDLRRHGVRLPDPPTHGKLDIKSVLDSQYFFA